MNDNKKQTWSLVYKIVITVLTSLAGILGLSSCIGGDPSQAACAASCATTAMLLRS